MKSRTLIENYSVHSRGICRYNSPSDIPTVIGGYFNLGEAVIYIAAMPSSPLVAGIARGQVWPTFQQATEYSHQQPLL